THIFDITDLDNVAYQGFYEGTSISIDHNLYVEDQFVYESNYRSGVRILDAIRVDDATLTEAGYFDLYPDNDFAAFSGTWSNYPYLPSGVDIATSMYDGVFIIMPKIIVLSQDSWDLCGTDEVIFDVQINAELAFPLTFATIGLGSVSVSANPATEQGTTTVTISGLSELLSGNYDAKLALQSSFGDQYEIPFHLNIASNQAEAPTLINVPNNSAVSNTATSTLFTWSAIDNADVYEFQLADDGSFQTPIEVETTDLTSFLLTYDLPDGIYHWRVRAVNGCGAGDWSEIFNFNITFVGVSEVEKANLMLYPNPAGDQLFVKYSQEIYEIEISDLSGKKIMTYAPERAPMQVIDLSSMASGVYFIKINGAAARFIKN
ncbi:MAG: choice-of-anchor B family protein, partial [Flavobacterium sp.]